MKVAIFGSKTLSIDISKFIPPKTTTIISDGTKGIGLLARHYADQHHIPKQIRKPSIIRYGKMALRQCTQTMIDSADIVVMILDGKLLTSSYELEYAKKMGKQLHVVVVFDYQ